MGSNLTPPWGGPNFYMGLYREKCRNLRVPSHKAWAYQVLHAAASSGPLPRMPKLMPWGQIWPHPGDTSFTWAYKGNILEISP